MLALVAAYTLTDLGYSSGGRCFLNNSGLIVAEVYETKGAVPKVYINGHWELLPPQVQAIWGLNNRGQIAFTGRRGWGVWAHGGVTLCHWKTPTYSGLGPPGPGVPIGIDDSGYILGVADGVEGIYSIADWPSTSIRGYQYPRPISMAPDGAWIGGSGDGFIRNPRYFLVDHGQRTEIKVDNPWMQISRVSSSHKVIGLWSSPGGSTQNWRHPFVWDNGVFYPLPFPPEAREVVADALNTEGDVVGRVENRGVIWRDRKMDYLDDLLGPDNKFEITESFAINDQGQILALASPKATHWPSTLVLLTPRRG